MPIKGFSCFSSCGQFAQWSKTILAIFVEGHSKITSLKYFEIEPFAYKKMSLKSFVFLALVAILCSQAEPF